MTPMWPLDATLTIIRLADQPPKLIIMDDLESDRVYTPEEMVKIKEWYTKSTNLRIAELKAKEEKNGP